MGLIKLSLLSLCLFLVNLSAEDNTQNSEIGVSDYYSKLAYSWTPIDDAFLRSKRAQEIPDKTDLIYFSAPRFSTVKMSDQERDLIDECYLNFVTDLAKQSSDSNPNKNIKFREVTLDATRSGGAATVLLNANPNEQKFLAPGAAGTLVISLDQFKSLALPQDSQCKTQDLLNYIRKIEKQFEDAKFGVLPTGAEGYKKILFDENAAPISSIQLPHGKNSSRFSEHPNCLTSKVELQNWLITETSKMTNPDVNTFRRFFRDLKDCQRARPELYPEVLACFEPYKVLFPTTLRGPKEEREYDLGMSISDSDYYSGKGLRNPNLMAVPKELSPGALLAEAIHGLKPIDEILEIVDRVNAENSKAGLSQKISVFRNISAFQGMDARDMESIYTDQMFKAKDDKEKLKKIDEQKKKHFHDFGNGRLVVFYQDPKNKEDRIFQVSYPLDYNDLTKSHPDKLYLMSQVVIEKNREDHSSKKPNIVRLGDLSKSFQDAKHTGYTRRETSDSCFLCHNQDSPVWLLGAHPDTEKLLTQKEKENLKNFNSQIKRYESQGIFLDASPYQGMDMPLLGEQNPNREKIVDSLISEHTEFLTESPVIRKKAILSTMNSCVDCHDKDATRSYRPLGLSDLGLKAWEPSTNKNLPGIAETNAIQAWLHKMSPKNTKLNEHEKFIVAEAFNKEFKGGSLTSTETPKSREKYEVQGKIGEWYFNKLIKNNRCLQDYLRVPEKEFLMAPPSLGSVHNKTKK